MERPDPSSTINPPLIRSIDPATAPVANTSGSLPAAKLVAHYSHPQHPLLRVNLPYLFTCAACKECGAGTRLTCQACDFDIHDFCALAPPSLLGHPLHSHHQLVFFTRSPDKGGLLRSNCDVCGKAAKGCAFRCTACSFVMHPCCSTLGAEMSFPVHAHPLYIIPSAGATAARTCGGGIVFDGRPCGLCHRRRRPGFVYRCAICDYQLHAVCAKAMRNGLHACGIKPPTEKISSRLLAAAKVASHVLLGIVGEFIEGIGEGLGQALVENVGKGVPSGNGTAGRIR